MDELENPENEEELRDNESDEFQKKLDEANARNGRLNQTCIALSQTLDMTRMRVKSLESEIRNAKLQTKLSMGRELIKALDLFESAEQSMNSIEEMIDQDESELASLFRNFCTGMRMGIKEILVSIKEQGIQKVEVGPGDEVNTEIHSVIDMISNDEFEPGKIVSIKRAGYQLNLETSKITIRPSEVLVAKE